MLTLDFTNIRKTSTASNGYFDKWNKLFGGWGDYDEYLEEEGELLETLTTTGNRSLGSYFNSPRNINRKTKWIFGNSDKRIEINSFELEGTEKEETGYFINNIFDLGNGQNYIEISLDFDSHETSNTTKSRLLTKGYSSTILGGSGRDTLNISARENERSFVGTKSYISINTKDGRDVIDFDTNFLLCAKIDSGSGSDKVDLGEANSSLVNAGAGNDNINLGRYIDYRFEKINIVKNIKDIIIGGSGVDRFIFNSGMWSSSYTLNGENDFCFIKDFEAKDKIILIEDSGELRIDKQDGKVKLAASGAYPAQLLSYTARVYSDGDLIAYISGSQPTIKDLTQLP